MNIFKALFGGKKEDEATSQKEHEARDFDILKYDGVRAMKTGRAEYAVKCFIHALDIRDDNEVHDYLSQALIANNELAEAMKELKIIAERVDANTALYLRMANVAYLMDDYEEMEKACDNVLAIEQDNEHAMYYLALAYEGQERHDDAVEVLTRIIDSAESALSARLLRGSLLLKGGKPAEALADAEALIEENSDNEDVLMLKARAKHALGQLEEAEELCSKVVELDPFSTDAFKERAGVRHDHGDDEGEKEDLRTLLELNPDETAVYDENPARTMEQKMKDNQINPLGL